MTPTQKPSFLNFLKTFFEARNISLSEAAREEWWAQLGAKEFEPYDISYVYTAIRQAGQESKYAMVQIGAVIEKLRNSYKPRMQGYVDEESMQKKLEEVKQKLLDCLPVGLRGSLKSDQAYMTSKFISEAMSNVQIWLKRNKPDQAKTICSHYLTVARSFRNEGLTEWPKHAHLEIAKRLNLAIKNAKQPYFSTPPQNLVSINGMRIVKNFSEPQRGSL